MEQQISPDPVGLSLKVGVTIIAGQPGQVASDEAGHSPMYFSYRIRSDYGFAIPMLSRDVCVQPFAGLQVVPGIWGFPYSPLLVVYRGGRASFIHLRYLLYAFYDFARQT